MVQKVPVTSVRKREKIVSICAYVTSRDFILWKNRLQDRIALKKRLLYSTQNVCLYNYCHDKNENSRHGHLVTFNVRFHLSGNWLNNRIDEKSGFCCSEKRFSVL